MFGSDSPTLQGKVKFAISKTVYLPYVEKKLLIAARHPLARYFMFYRVVVSDRKSYWVCPELRISKTREGKIKIITLDQNLPWRFWALGISIAMLLLPCVIYPYWHKKRADILVKYSTLKDWFNVSIIWGTCWLSLVLLLICSDNLITSASDDPGYFKTAHDMLALDFKGPWTFTIGLGLWYIPFILSLGAETFYDIALQFANFCGFIVMPATIILTYFVIKKLAASRSKALVSVIMLALFPFFYHYLQDWNEHCFKAFFSIPSVSFNNRFYNTILLCGYNCMSDTPSNFLIMLCCLLILYMPVKIRFAVVVSLVYALACLVRINNIFFAPLLAWLFWKRLSEKDVNIRYTLKTAAAAAAVFLIGFLPQLIINQLQFGSFLTFPYILHNNESAKGFQLAVLDTGINFMGGANFAIWAAGLSGMLFIRNRQLRNTLVLWAVPVILFFFGYPCIFTDARRFIITSFAAMVAAFVCVEVWEELSVKERIASSIIMGAGLLFLTPDCYLHPEYLPFELQNCSWGVKFVTVMSILMPLL
ncbi:MAG: hypothetical protein PHV82_10265, partial [Victivallaceae bacterium]|nr:hypothetical protein [Victivallaceae bacterium]